MLSRAVVVTTIGSLSAFAALARATTLCFSSPIGIARIDPMLRGPYDRDLSGH
jgi:hypothetical protein